MSPQLFLNQDIEGRSRSRKETAIQVTVEPEPFLHSLLCGPCEDSKNESVWLSADNFL